MNSLPDYELLDFGEGRKLERFSAYIFDRPAAAASGAKKHAPDLWQKRHARYEGDRISGGRWTPPWGDDHWRWGTEVELRNVLCEVNIGRGFKLLSRPRSAGQVGIFPEQVESWRWVAQQVERTGGAPEVLNLFAYTGASTLTAAAAGARVVHVDAAKQAIEAAAANARFSQMDNAPIRWIVEDALKFCRREAKRGNRYDAVILDPPTYGHGPKGEEWLIKSDLLPLLEVCGKLVERRPKFVLLTCHTPGIGPAELAAYLADGIFGHCGQPPRTGELALETADGRRLPSGVYARWPS